MSYSEELTLAMTEQRSLAVVRDILGPRDF